MRLKRKLLHKILRYAEEHATGRKLAAPEFEDYSEQEVNYHIGLCHEAGFLHICNDSVTPGKEGVPTYYIQNLTWQGHLELEEKKYACQN